MTLHATFGCSPPSIVAAGLMAGAAASACGQEAPRWMSEAPCSAGGGAQQGGGCALRVAAGRVHTIHRVVKQSDMHAQVTHTSMIQL